MNPQRYMMMTMMMMTMARRAGHPSPEYIYSYILLYITIFYYILLTPLKRPRLLRLHDLTKNAHDLNTKNIVKGFQFDILQSSIQDLGERIKSEFGFE